MLSAAMVAWLGMPLAGAPPAQAMPPRDPAAQAPAASRSARFGLVHVDNMDLHARRRADAAPVDVEVLPPEDLADRYRRAAESGAGWHRWSIYWDLVVRDGQPAWAVPDGIVERDRAHGLATLAVLQGNPPGVAHLAGAPEGIGAPIFDRADGSVTDDPAEAAAIHGGNGWARFVAAVVDRYRPGGALARERGWGVGGGVRAWQIGNEPNLPGFWRGTPAEYARFLEVAYLVVKWLDPGATVAHAGIADDAAAAAWYGQFADALKARAAVSPLPARHGFYFDKAAWHWYRSPSLLQTGPDRARALLAERGLPAKPIWVTEIGLPVWSEYPGPCWDPASPGRATVAEQAGYIWQAVAEGLAAGVETMFVFQLYDDCGNGAASYDAFGLVRNHHANQCWQPPGQGCWAFDARTAGAPRPSFEAFKVAVRELGAARLVRQVPAAAGGGRRVVFARPDAQVTVAWSTAAGDRAVALDAAAASAMVYAIDAGGTLSSRPAGAAGGQLTVALPGVTNHNGIGGRPIMAGRPVIVVEHGAGAAWAGSGTGQGAIPPSSAPGAGPGDPAGTAGTGPGDPGGPGGGGGSRGGAGSAQVVDLAPPVLAVVAPLPPSSPRTFDLTVVAGDESGGLDAFVVYAATGPAPPRVIEEWAPVGSVRPWPGRPRHGQVRIAFEGPPGTWYFAAQAGDLAGNWTALPAYAQASTRIAGAVPAARQRARRIRMD